MKKVILIALYVILAILLCPILAYQAGIILPEYPWIAYIQIFASAPGILVIGMILYFTYKHKVSGVLCILISLWWFYLILYEVFTEN